MMFFGILILNVINLLNTFPSGPSKDKLLLSQLFYLWLKDEIRMQKLGCKTSGKAEQTKCRKVLI